MGIRDSARAARDVVEGHEGDAAAARRRGVYCVREGFVEGRAVSADRRGGPAAELHRKGNHISAN